MKTKPFNLEEALNGAKVVTRDGLEVTQLTKFEGVTTESHSLVGVLRGRIYLWTDEGRFNDVFATEPGKDLFLAAEPQRVYVNVYISDDTIHTGGNYNTLEAAKKAIHQNLNYIKTIEITDEP